MAEDEEYEVGYGKPPKQNQWKPGQSGNPNGRRGKRKQEVEKGVVDQLREIALGEIPITENGEQHMVRYQEVLVRQLLYGGLEAPFLQRMKLLGWLLEIGVFSPETVSRMPTQSAVDEFVKRLAQEYDDDQKKAKYGPKG